MNIDRIFIINMDARTDRWENIERQLKNLNITNYERFSAIRPTDKMMKDYKHFSKKHEINYRKGALGCLLSHYEIIKISKDRKYKYVLILEDDTEFIRSLDELNKNINILLNYDKDFKICYLSGSHIESPYKLIDEIAKVTKTYTTNSYIINENIFDFILNNLKTSPSEIDVFYAKEIQTKFNCYCIIPHITKQISGYSDIQQKSVSYNL